MLNILRKAEATIQTPAVTTSLPAVTPAPRVNFAPATATYAAAEFSQAAVFAAAGPTPKMDVSKMDSDAPLQCMVCFSFDHDSSQCSPTHLATRESNATAMLSNQEEVNHVSWFENFLAFLGVLMAFPIMVMAGMGDFCKKVMPSWWVIVILVVCFLSKVSGTCYAPSPTSFCSVQCYVSSPNQDLLHKPPPDYEWVGDTGCNRFVTNDIKDFVPGSIRTKNTQVTVGSGMVVSPCEGTIMVRSHANNQLLACTHALLLPDCPKKLMPARPFLKKGCTLAMNGVSLTIHNDKSEVLLEGKEFGGLYYFNASTAHLENSEVLPVPDCSADPGPSSSFFGLPLSGKIRAVGDNFVRKLTEAHCALGHMPFDKIRKLFGLKRGPNPDCATCSIAKQKQSKLTPHLKTRSNQLHKRYHLDLAFTEGSSNPFQLCVDDCSRMGYLQLLESKSEAFEKFVELKSLLDNRFFPLKCAFVKTDNEFIYTSNAWLDYCRTEGVEHEFSARYRHDQNGVVERAIGVVGKIFRCLMIQGGAPDSEIPNALVHANNIRNNTPTEANNGWTPKEKEAGMKLGINARLLKGPLFCLCYAHIYEEEPARVKHGARGVACVYLGYDDRNDQYKVKEWTSGRIYYTGDAVFHPTIFPYRASPATSDLWIKEMDALSPAIPVSPDHPAPHAMPTGPRRSDRQHGYIYSAGQRVRDIPDIDHAPLEIARSLVVHSFGPNPDNWAEALASRHAQHWIVASLEEKASFGQHGVYELVPREEAGGKKIYRPRPVFDIKVDPPTKTNPEATLDKFKFRQTIACFAKGCTQGVDFAEKRASTVRWEATLVQFALAVNFDLDISLLDIKTFFLYGVLPESDTVYMEQPPEWVDERYPATDYICHLLKSMYGLPQAPHCAQEKLKTTILANPKFSQTSADDCVFVAGGSPTDNGYVVTGSHVDDLLTVGTPVGIAALTSTLRKEFEITEKPNPAMVTGVQIERNREAKWLKLHQASYVDTILEVFGQTDCTPADTPMDAATSKAFMLLPVATVDTVDPRVQKKYRTLVGMLIWLYKTRPDMMFTINLLARHVHDSTQAHLDMARSRPLRYLKGTKFFGLVFSPGESSDWTLSGSSDADLAGDLATSRSTVGFYSRLGKYGTVSYNCSLERKIATSTQQAETYALLYMVKDTIWIRQLIYELGFLLSGASPQRTDNQGTYLQSSKQVNHGVAKHFRIAQAYIREQQALGFINVQKIGTKFNASDLFTKGSIAKDLFFRFRLEIMGPQECPNLP